MTLPLGDTRCPSCMRVVCCGRLLGPMLKAAKLAEKEFDGAGVRAVMHKHVQGYGVEQAMCTGIHIRPSWRLWDEREWSGLREGF